MRPMACRHVAAIPFPTYAAAIQELRHPDIARHTKAVETFEKFWTEKGSLGYVCS